MSCDNIGTSNESDGSSSSSLKQSLPVDSQKRSVSPIVQEENEYVKDFFSNGEIKSEGLVKQSKRIGTWKFYNAQSELDSVLQYQDGDILLRLDKNDFNFRTVEVPNERIQLKVPKSWNTKVQSSSQLLLTSYKKVDQSIKFRPNVSLTVDTVFSGSLEDFMKSYLSDVVEKYSAKIVYQSKLKSDTVELFQSGYMFMANQMNLGTVVTFTKINNRIYSVSGVASNQSPSSFLEYKGLFEEIGISITSY